MLQFASGVVVGGAILLTLSACGGATTKTVTEQSESESSMTTLNESEPSVSANNDSEATMEFELLTRSFNMSAATSGDPAAAFATDDQQELTDRWKEVSREGSPNPMLEGRVGVFVNGGPTYRNLKVMSVLVNDDGWTVKLSVQRVIECNTIAVEASEVIVLAVDAEEVPTSVETDVIERDGCDE